MEPRSHRRRLIRVCDDRLWSGPTDTIHRDSQPDADRRGFRPGARTDLAVSYVHANGYPANGNTCPIDPHTCPIASLAACASSVGRYPGDTVVRSVRVARAISRMPHTPRTSQRLRLGLGVLPTGRQRERVGLQRCHEHRQQRGRQRPLPVQHPGIGGLRPIPNPVLRRPDARGTLRGCVREVARWRRFVRPPLAKFLEVALA